MWSTDRILKVLDGCAADGWFPMLDNGYVYLAATRLSLHRSPADWALVIEVFGYSPRAGLPDLHVYTFGSRLRDRDDPADHRTPEARAQYLAYHLHDEHRFFAPIADGPWLAHGDCNSVADDARTVVVRGRTVDVPIRDTLASHGIVLDDPHHIRVWEVCRYLADTHRGLVLGTPDERRVNVPHELEELLVLDEWRHPDLLRGEKPSTAAAFIAFADVLASGDVTRYAPTAPPNTHWSHWPDGGML